MNDKRALYAVVLVAIILLLLMARRIGPRTTVDNSTPINLSTTEVTYNVPPLKLGSGSWDWMQTTDMSCGCDVGLWKEPIVIEQIGSIITSYPSYQYITNNTTTVSPAPIPNFPVYTPPPLPTWWIEWGYNVHHEQASYYMTSTGVNVILGKYSRAEWPIPGSATWTQQTKEYTIQGGQYLITGGQKYVHDTSKDQTRPPGYSGGSGGLFMATG